MLSRWQRPPTGSLWLLEPAPEAQGHRGRIPTPGLGEPSEPAGTEHQGPAARPLGLCMLSLPDSRADTLCVSQPPPPQFPLCPRNSRLPGATRLTKMPALMAVSGIRCLDLEQHLEAPECVGWEPPSQPHIGDESARLADGYSQEQGGQVHGGTPGLLGRVLLLGWKESLSASGDALCTDALCMGSGRCGREGLRRQDTGAALPPL